MRVTGAPPARRTIARGIVVGALALVGACGGGDADPLVGLREQTVHLRDLSADCSATTGPSCVQAAELREALGHDTAEAFFGAWRARDVERLEELWSGDGDVVVVLGLDGPFEASDVGPASCDDFRTGFTVRCEVTFALDGVPGRHAQITFAFQEEGSLLFLASSVLRLDS